MKSILSIFASLFLICSAQCQLVPTPAIVSGDLVFVTAQFPIDPATGHLIFGPMATLTDATIMNIKTALKKKGAKLNEVIKVTVCLSDMRELSAMNAAYVKQFNTDTPPTLEVIESVNMPYGSRIQMSCIADRSRH